MCSFGLMVRYTLNGMVRFSAWLLGFSFILMTKACCIYGCKRKNRPKGVSSGIGVEAGGWGAAAPQS